MNQKSTVMRVNSNFHHIEGDDILARRDSIFEDYRRKWDGWPRRFYVGGFPLFIDIEVTSACNLKCPFCATTYRGGNISHGFISFDVVKRIIDEGSQAGLYGVKFNIRGEPLLHPQIHEFVRYAKSKGLIDVYFNTNAVLLTEEASIRLIEAGLDRISISFEGHTKEVYEKQRVGASYETVLKNIEDIQRLKKKRAVHHPRIRIQTVMLPELINDIEIYRQFWLTRADEVAFLDYKRMKAKRKGLRYKWACPQIWQRMAVWWDGTILPCNHDDDGLIAMGNIKDITIRQAWHSKKMTAIRAAHQRGESHTISACDGCYLRDSEIEKIMEEERKI